MRCAALWPADRTLGPESLPALLEEKRLLVNRSGVIEYIAAARAWGKSAAWKALKKWLLERRKLFHMRDSLSEEIVPKGVLIMGIPGCGKSLSRQGHRVAFPTAALPRRHDRDLLRPARQAGRRFRAGVPHDGGHGAGGALVRRNRNGHHVHRFRRRTGPHLRLLPHLDAGEDARASSSPQPPTASTCCPPR